jgi:pyridoxine 5'-phosphate synthase PdxJ
MQLLRPVIASLRELKSRVILFVDPDPTVLDRVIQVGGEGIEIFTGAMLRTSAHDNMPRCLTRVPKPRGRQEREASW